MSTAPSGPVVRHASHGAVSLLAGFLTGFALFVAVGAATTDATFSALVLALFVTLTRAAVVTVDR